MQYTFKVVMVTAMQSTDEVEQDLNDLGADGYRPFLMYGNSYLIMGKEWAEASPRVARKSPQVEYGDTTYLGS